MCLRSNADSTHVDSDRDGCSWRVLAPWYRRGRLQHGVFFVRRLHRERAVGLPCHVRTHAVDSEQRRTLSLCLHDRPGSATNQELCAKGKRVLAPFDNGFLCVQGSDALTSNPTFYTGSRMASMQNCDAQLRNSSSACFYGGAWRAV